MALIFSKPTSQKVFFSLLTALVILQCVFHLALPAQAGAVVVGICVWMLVWVTANTFRFACARQPEANPLSPPVAPLGMASEPSEAELPSLPAAPGVAPLVEAQAEASPPAEADEALLADYPTPLLPTTAPPSRTKERLYYLDNLKVFLTVLVIVHHQICSFVGVGWYFTVGAYTYKNLFHAFGTTILEMDQSYFMCVFFFISGYFTPASFERKGRRLFLRDKFVRLGVPWVVFTFVLSPLLTMMNRAFRGQGTQWLPDFNPGPLWFTGWLLVFNYAYACTDHSAPTVMSAPSPLRMLGYTLPLDVLQFVLMGAMGGTFAFMPIVQGSLPFDVMFFYGGCIARRNKWLEATTEGGVVELMDKHRRWVYVIIVVHSVYNIIYSTIYKPQINDNYDGIQGQVWLGSCLFLGSWLFVALVPYAQMDLFRKHFNWTGRWSRCLAGASYTAYIVHPFFVCAASGAFVATYEAVTGQQIVFPEGQGTSETVLASNAWLWGGCAVCTVASVLVVFFFAHWFRELCPGAKHIL